MNRYTAKGETTASDYICNGSLTEDRHAPNWSADRIRKEFPQFDLSSDGKDPIHFTGEMVGQSKSIFVQ